MISTFSKTVDLEHDTQSVMASFKGTFAIAVLNEKRSDEVRQLFVGGSMYHVKHVSRQVLQSASEQDCSAGNTLLGL